MAKLSDKDRDKIIEILESGKDLPLDYRHILFPPEKKEYELSYVGKEREEDILADTMSVPLQPVKTFGTNDNDWTNKLIFGDNLQVMKSLLDDPDVKGQVKMIYIDPPFATKKDFRGSQDQKAYQDKIAGTQFIEFLRKRLVLMRGLLASDGAIYVHLDWRNCHFIRVIMDEVFGETNFQNEVIVHYTAVGLKAKSKKFHQNTETILYYVKKKGEHIWNEIYEPIKDLTKYRTASKHVWNSKKGKAERMRDTGGKIKYFQVTEYKPDNFIEVPALRGNDKIGYPTQKHKAILERIISASSNPGDIVLDCFVGSGTTLVAAEKLGRKWIGIDCGKLAIYTIQKRLLNLKTEMGSKKRHLNTKPFTLYSAGLYDFKQLRKLPWEGWRKFGLLLFNCLDKRHRVGGVELDGYRGLCDVLVFNHLKDPDLVLDHGFVDDLNSMIGSKVGNEFFIIAPAAKVVFLEDYIDKGHTRYYILRIPYSIINELHNRDFEAIKQPIDESQVNDTVDAVGFDFIRPPKVVCEYCIKKPTAQLLDVASIKIKTFKSEAMLRGASQLGNRESLSMVMVDFNYNGDTFNLNRVFYASDIEDNKWEVHLPVESFKGKIMVIYLDIYGNEYREIKRLEDFKHLRKRRK